MKKILGYIILTLPFSILSMITLIFCGLKVFLIAMGGTIGIVLTVVTCVILGYKLLED